MSSLPQTPDDRAGSTGSCTIRGFSCLPHHLVSGPPPRHLSVTPHSSASTAKAISAHAREVFALMSSSFVASPISSRAPRGGAIGCLAHPIGFCLGNFFGPLTTHCISGLAFPLKRIATALCGDTAISLQTLIPSTNGASTSLMMKKSTTLG